MRVHIQHTHADTNTSAMFHTQPGTRGEMQIYIYKALTTAYNTHSTSTLHSRHAFKNPQVSHYSRLLKLCWLVIAQRPQPDYSSSQSPSGWLGSEYELSHCNKPHLVTGSITASLSLHRPSMQTGHFKTSLPVDCSSLSKQFWSGVYERMRGQTQVWLNNGMKKWSRALWKERFAVEGIDGTIEHTSNQRQILVIRLVNGWQLTRLITKWFCGCAKGKRYW